MKRIVITDTSSSFTLEEANQKNIKLIPLNILIDDKSYNDLYEISYNEIYSALKNGKMPSTSQPSIGIIYEIFEGLKKENYDHIYVPVISSHLSGTYQTIISVKEDLQMGNVTIIDSKSAGEPLKNLALLISDAIEKEKQHDEIISLVNDKISKNLSLIYPTDLNHLKRGGRISPLVYPFVSLLKIKILLYLDNSVEKIEKLSTCKTDKKLYETVFEKLSEDFDETNNKLAFLHSYSDEEIKEIIEVFKTKYPNLKYEVRNLPSILLCHIGLNSLVIQKI